MKSNLVPEAHLRYNKEILISPETEKTRNNKGIEGSIKKWNTIKYLFINYKLLNDSTVSKFLSRKCIKINYLAGGRYSVNRYIRFKCFE